MDLVHLVQTALIGGTAVTLATEIMKNRWFPVPAQHYPRITAAIASVIAAAVALYWQGVTLVTLGHSFVVWLAYSTACLLIAVVTYNQLVKKPNGVANTVPKTVPPAV